MKTKSIVVLNNLIFKSSRIGSLLGDLLTSISIGYIDLLYNILSNPFQA